MKRKGKVETTTLSFVDLSFKEIRKTAVLLPFELLATDDCIVFELIFFFKNKIDSFLLKKPLG